MTARRLASFLLTATLANFATAATHAPVSMARGGGGLGGLPSSLLNVGDLDTPDFGAAEQALRDVAPQLRSQITRLRLGASEDLATRKALANSRNGSHVFEWPKGHAPA